MADRGQRLLQQLLQVRLAHVDDVEHGARAAERRVAGVVLGGVGVDVAQTAPPSVAR